jgi:dTDP-4-dehydrorhamnose reductase
VSSPTYNRDLARATLLLAGKGAAGVVNVAGTEVMDRAAFAVRLARALGLDERLIDPVETRTLGQTAARPLAAGLRTERLLAELPAFAPLRPEEAVLDWTRNPRGRELLP